MRDEETNWLGYSIDFRTNNPNTLKFEISLGSENYDVSSNESRKNQDNCFNNGRICLVSDNGIEIVRNPVTNTEHVVHFAIGQLLQSRDKFETVNWLIV